MKARHAPPWAHWRKAAPPASPLAQARHAVGRLEAGELVQRVDKTMRSAAARANAQDIIDDVDERLMAAERQAARSCKAALWRTALWCVFGR